MSKRNKHSLLKKWPEDDTRLPVIELLPPLRKIIYDGYELKRKDTLYFNYLGYDIGEADLISSPNPAERFSSRWLSHEQKHKRYLIDNVLMTAFQLGIEQGRRTERQGKIPYDVLLQMYEERGQKLELYREKLKGYGEDHSIEADISLSNDDLDLIIPGPDDVEPIAPKAG